MSEQRVIGTIKGVLRGALDGTPVRVVSRTEFGYVVELLVPKGLFMEGDKLYIDDDNFSPLTTSSEEAGDRDVGFSLIEDPEILNALRQRFLQEWSTAA